MFGHLQAVAEVAEEPGIEQVHHSMLLAPDVQIHRHPVVCQLPAEGPEKHNPGSNAAWRRAALLQQLIKANGMPLLPQSKASSAISSCSLGSERLVRDRSFISHTKVPRYCRPALGFHTGYLSERQLLVLPRDFLGRPCGQHSHF